MEEERGWRRGEGRRLSQQQCAADATAAVVELTMPSSATEVAAARV